MPTAPPSVQTLKVGLKPQCGGGVLGLLLSWRLCLRHTTAASASSRGTPSPMLSPTASMALLLSLLVLAMAPESSASLGFRVCAPFVARGGAAEGAGLAGAGASWTNGVRGGGAGGGGGSSGGGGVEGSDPSSKAAKSVR